MASENILLAPVISSTFEAAMFRSILRISMSAALAITSLVPARAPAQSTTGAQQAVLVTGASSGIGRKITESLAAQGYFVYAGARKPEDLTALNAIKNVQAVKLD